MDKKFFFGEIDDLLQLINEQHHIIKDYEFHTPQIEIDLIKANIRKLYDYYHKIDKLNNKAFDRLPATSPIKEEVRQEQKQIQKSVVQPEPSSGQGQQKPAPPADKKENIPVQAEEQGQKGNQENEAGTPRTEKPGEHAPQDKPQQIEPPVTGETEALHSKPTDPIASPKPVENPAQKPVPEAVKPKKQSKSRKKPVEGSGNLFEDQQITLADKLKASGKPSLNERIDSPETDKSLFNLLKRKPVTDIKAAIGLNDRFLFINDLFDGKSDEYNSFIDQLNNASNAEDAWNKLEARKESRSWDESRESYQKLLDFVERRFL